MQIPEKIFVAKRGDNTLAYVTYCEDNAAFQKRKATGLSWARLSENGGEVLENTLLSNYSILNNVSRWTTSNVVWRILDPRGFEFEIYSGNMMELLRTATIEAGIIKDRCILSFDNGKPVLLPENSEPYLKAVEATRVIKSSNKTTLTLNSVYIDDKANVFQYLGNVNIIREEIDDNYRGYDWTRTSRLSVTPKKYHVFKLLKSGKDRSLYLNLTKDNILFILPNPKVVDYLDYTGELTRIDDVVEYVKTVKNLHYISNVSTYDIIGFSHSAKIDMTFSVSATDSSGFRMSESGQLYNISQHWTYPIQMDRNSLSVKRLENCRADWDVNSKPVQIHIVVNGEVIRNTRIL